MAVMQSIIMCDFTISDLLFLVPISLFVSAATLALHISPHTRLKSAFLQLVSALLLCVGSECHHSLRFAT